MTLKTYPDIIKYTIKLFKNKGLRIRFHQAFYEQSAGAFPETYIVDQPINLTKSEIEPIRQNLNYGTKNNLNDKGELINATHLGFGFWVGFDVKPSLFDDGPDKLSGGKLVSLED